jgi:predicted amidophosphoribosyltransferase
MKRPWDDNPDDYYKKIICESCGTELKEHFEPCPKCFSTARHFPKYIKKEKDDARGRD